MQNAPTHEPFMRAGENSSVWTRWFTFLVMTLNHVGVSGTTAERPNPAPFVGFMYFDTTVNRPIWAKTLTSYVFADGSTA